MSNLTGIYANGTKHGNSTLLLRHRLCTLETCDLSLASFLYIPTLPGNAVYAGVFAALLFGQLYLNIRHKSWGYMVAMIAGLLCEIIGYFGRIMLHFSPFGRSYFLMYLTTLTIGPAFLSAAIYLCLSKIVVLYNPQLSRFKPRSYTIFFCVCDMVSLVLQAAGGGIASSGNTSSLVSIGKNIMLAGLGFQVLSLTLFAVCGIDFAIRARIGRKFWNPQHLTVINSRRFSSFLVGLSVATVTIFARSIYRCVELSGGFHGELFVSDEALFMVMEGAMICIAAICLTLLHPALCFQHLWQQVEIRFRTRKESSAKRMQILSDEGSATELNSRTEA